MFWRLLWFVLGGVALLPCAWAEERLLIATAANFKPVMQAWIAEFAPVHRGVIVEAAYGSSGKLSAQIREGAPFDLFFSADLAFAQALVDDGAAAPPAKVYARGRLALWSATVDARTLTIADLVRTEFVKVAIANPRTAPYGARAVEALKSAGVWTQVTPRLVYGESIAQTAQFVQSGNAQIGLIALAQALHPDLVARGGHALIPDALHSPLDQAFVITRRGADKRLAAAFAAYASSDAARRIIERYGYTRPVE